MEVPENDAAAGSENAVHVVEGLFDESVIQIVDESNAVDQICGGSSSFARPRMRAIRFSLRNVIWPVSLCFARSSSTWARAWMSMSSKRHVETVFV